MHTRSRAELLICDSRQLLGSEAAGISPRVMAFTTLGRMVIIPLCHGTLLYALLDLLPEGHLVRVSLAGSKHLRWRHAGPSLLILLRWPELPTGAACHWSRPATCRMRVRPATGEHNAGDPIRRDGAADRLHGHRARAHHKEAQSGTAGGVCNGSSVHDCELHDDACHRIRAACDGAGGGGGTFGSMSAPWSSPIKRALYHCTTVTQQGGAIGDGTDGVLRIVYISDSTDTGSCCEYTIWDTIGQL
eukprot:6902035-Prymnesium_polylepis.1